MWLTDFECSKKMVDKSKIIKEACVDSLDQALKAESLGADRIELCSRLDLDGLTPSQGLLEECASRLKIPIRAMIRPREGSFVYNNQEVEQMFDAIAFCKALKIEGVVFGALNEAKKIDLNVTERLAIHAENLKITFHKAFDITSNPIDEFKALAKLKLIDAVLTSGQKPTAFEGVNLLKELIDFGSSYPKIIVAGKVTNHNIDELHTLVNATQYHGKKIVGNLD